MNAILLLKLFLVPSLILAVTLAGRRWGPRVAGWLSAFPVVSGPILLAIAIEQGNAFAAHAAEGTLLAVLAILIFSLVYAWVSARLGIALSMLLALAAWVLCVASLQAWQTPLAIAFCAVLAGLLLAPSLFPAVPAAASPAARPGSGDLVLRMVAGAMLVVGVTWAASQIGPRLSGFFAMFPVMSTVLVGFSHHRCGRHFAVQMLRGMVAGYYAFAAFCVALAVLLPLHGPWLAFPAAIACALLSQLVHVPLACLRRRWSRV
jgi:hypothetical protein